MPEFRVVPDSFRERKPLVRGGIPRSDLSIKLLGGFTLFVPESEGAKFGSLYSLAKRHNKIAHTRKDDLNGEKGTTIWFEDLVSVEEV